MVEDDDRETNAMAVARPPDEEVTNRGGRERERERERDPKNPPLGPGTDIGGYIVDGEIGKGGMGFVYSATHPMIGKRAAIKVLKPEVSSSKIIVDRFIQEARAVNQIGHPNIIDIFAFGWLPDGRAYHIMDLLVGESLRKRLRRGPLHPSEVASVIEEIASALMAAHDKGFVHRDLKPDNVYLVEREGRWPEVKLLDFGLAKLMPEMGSAPFQTKAGVMLGTPEYMSPEQALGKAIDYRTDIYALGVVMYEILAGQRPFATLGDPFSTLQQHADEPPPSIRELAPTLPEEMVQLVDTMLAKEPTGRPSLNAVRTVIKRLRSTQLPTRTQAGLEISLPGLKIPPALDVRPSRVGAEAVLPGDSMRGQVQAQPQPHSSQPMPRTMSQPPGISQPMPRASQPPGVSQPMQRAISHPPGMSQPMAPAAAASQPMQKFVPNVTPAPSPPMSPALAGASQPHPGTKLGVGPAKAPSPSSSAMLDATNSAAMSSAGAAAKKSSRVWLILGALLAIAAGVVLALVLVGAT